MSAVGMRGCATVVAVLQYKPMCIEELARNVGVKQIRYSNFRRTLHNLMQHRILYIHGWEKRRGNSAMVLAVGEQENAPYPGKPLPARAGRMPYRADVTAFSTIWHTLKTGAHTIEELCSLTGCEYITVLRLLRHMRELNLVYVHSWARIARRGPPNRLYALGDKPDARRPAPLPKKQIMRMYTARKREVEKFAPLEQAWRMAA